MPSALKKWMLNELMEQFRECEHLLFVEYQGITALNVFELRTKLREVGAEMQVIKNSIAALVLKEIGRENAKDFLDGPVAVISGGDAAAAAKVLTTFKETGVPIKGGVLGGKVLSADDAIVLSKLPSREAMLSQTAGVLQAPLSKCVNLLQAPVKSLHNCMLSLKSKLSS